MYNFVENREANEHINKVHSLLEQGKSDTEICDIFNEENISNLQSPSEKWNVEQVSNMRQTFKLDTNSPSVIADDAPQNKKASKILIFLSIIIVLIIGFLNFSEALFQHLETGKLVGRTMGAVLFPLIVVGLFQLGKGFRNSSSRVKIFFWAALAMFVVKALGISSSLSHLPSQTSLIPELGTSVDANRVESLKEAIAKVKEKTKSDTANLQPLDEVTTKAEAGDADAQEDLGERYLNGMGVKISKQKAYDWYLKSAEQGNATAQYWVGDLEAYNVTDVTPNERTERAMKWYLKAANGCNKSAQSSLAYIYEKGVIGRATEATVKIDLDKAMKWYKASALNAHGGSMAQLGLLLAKKTDASDENKIKGVAWYYVSNKLHGDGAYKEQFEAIRKQMTPEQVSQAKEISQKLLQEVNNHKCVPITVPTYLRK